MPKKNAFICFIDEMRRTNSSNRGKSTPELVSLYGGVWAQMSADERKPFEDEAKGTPRGKPRKVYTTIGTELSREMEELREKRQEETYLENLIEMSVFEERSIDELLHKSFFVVSFNVMVKTYEGVYHTNEIGIVEFSIADGIRNYYHQFIDPGDVPMGYARMVKEHAESTHQIPVNFANAVGNARKSDDSRDIERRMKEFGDMILEICELVKGSKLKTKVDNKTGGNPMLLFCKKSQIPQVKGCLKFICDESVEYSNLVDQFVVLDVVQLLVILAKKVGQARPYGVCDGEMSLSSYDYSPNTNCQFHDEKDVPHCALGVAKRCCYMLFDVACKLFNVSLTDKHTPCQANDNLEVKTFVPLPSFQTNNRSRNNRYFDDNFESEIPPNTSATIRAPRDLPDEHEVIGAAGGLARRRADDDSKVRDPRRALGIGRGVRVPR